LLIKVFYYKERSMKNKRFWLGMLVLTLVFGMTVIGCEEEETPEETKFQETVTVTQIPGDRNGQTFTMSLIKDGNTFVTKGGTITGNSATAEFVVEKSSDLPNSSVLFDNQYKCFLLLKIGDDTAKVSKKEIGFTISSEGSYLGSQSDTYANLFN
jgi:hypothetical protein